MKLLRAVPLLLLCALPARAQAPTLTGPKVVRARGILTLTFTGPLEAGREYEARLLGNSETTAVTVRVDAAGQATAELRTARLLLPGAYQLEVEAKGGGSKTQLAFRLGSAEEEQDAVERLRNWRLGALATFRELTAGLERRGAYHLAKRAAAPDDAKGAEEERLKRFLPGWDKALRMARMDLATYQRRLLLPPQPEITSDLLFLVDLLKARAKVWAKALEPFGTAPGANTPVQKVAARLLAALGLPAERISEWRGGPLATPPPEGAKAGETYRAPIGFRLDVPKSAEILETNDPFTRLAFKFSTVNVTVVVGERPDALTPEALVRRVEVDAWESWDSYKRLSSLPIADGQGLRLEFGADLLGRDVVVVQRSLFPKAGGRVYTLRVVRLASGEWPVALQVLEESFELVAK